MALLLAERLRLDRSAVVAAGVRRAGNGRRTRGTGHGRRAPAELRSLARARGPGPAPERSSRSRSAPTRRTARTPPRSCASLRADQVWAVVDARTKTVDAATWMAQVGGDVGVDAVAVRGLFDTAQPGTVLDLGVPVAWVDGVPATTVAWAAALGQALGRGRAGAPTPAR